MPIDPRDNDALLKLDLYCKGAHVDDSVMTGEASGRPVLRTRAGLGSGLEVVIGGRHWTNVPVTESFAAGSPYVFRYHDGRLRLYLNGEPIRDVELAPLPNWYQCRTTSGRLMSRVGTLQGTYLGIYPVSVCDFWTGDEPSNCHFCSVGLNLGGDDANEKSVAEVTEVARVAVEQSNVTYVDFNTGHYEGETYLDRIEPYIDAVKEQTGLLIGLQTPPHSDLERYRDLRKRGVNRVSFCFEIFDPERFADVCPGKAKTYGLQRYLDAVEWTAALGRESSAAERLADPWVVNGEIIAGLEPPESTIKAIDWITSVGAIPTVCVFRPLKGTDYEHLPSPKTEEMIPIFERLYDACMERSLPIGLAPNVNVSLVLLPEECRALSRKKWRYVPREMGLKVMKKVFEKRFYASRQAAMERAHTA